MAKQIIEEHGTDIKQLIRNITGIEEETEKFSHLYKQVTNKLKKSHVVQFVNKRDVDRCINGMAEKFVFHNFPMQAQALQDYYEDYANETSAADLPDRLNVVMFLIAMSDRPTTKFLENPDEYIIREEKAEEQIIDWGKYLTEGIEKWEPKFDETSESAYSSDGSDLDEETNEVKIIRTATTIESNTQLPMALDFKTNRHELLNTIQHTWFNEKYHDAPFSQRKEANVAILWEQFLEKQTNCLIDIPRSNILSEYKVIREILWQLWSPHSSVVFEFQRNKLKPRDNVTISSVRLVSFYSFLEKQFVPCIEVMGKLRDFSMMVERNYGSACVPGTYKSYNSSLQNLTRPVYWKLVELEEKIRDQEVTYTLLDLKKDLGIILEPVFLLEKIHNEVVIDFNTNSSLYCATMLLSRLHNGIQFAENKLDQDLRLSLYLESLYHYLTMVDSWLVKNHLSEQSEDFMIKIVTDNDERKFEVCSELEPNCKEDGILKIIGDSVLQIGKNLNLLRQLGKLPFPNKSKGTIYEEFVDKSLEELCRFFSIQDKNKDAVPAEQSVSETEESPAAPVILTEYCKPNDKLENLEDSIDGYLMLAFKDFFIKKPDTRVSKGSTLLERISNVTKSFFPAANFFENILNGILRERFTVSGLMVKSILIEEYLLEKQFQFLRHVFLFMDDIIFPFYRRLFEKIIYNKSKWGNSIWLTSHLHDILIDIYPQFYEGCLVQVDKNWELALDSLHICSMVSLSYEIQWPLDIIIKPQQMDMYKSLFQYICRLKWGLYTLNHLSFTDLEPKGKQLRKHKQTKAYRDFIKKLKFLKFALTNLMNSIQHYIFSFIFIKCLQKFELDFEKAYDITSIIESHEQFISTTHSMVSEIPQIKEVLICIKDLNFTWNNIKLSSPEKLHKMYKSYKNALGAINPIICPIYIFDY